MSKSTATAHITLFWDFRETNYTIHNSVLQDFLATHDLTSLLEDGQDVEEFFLNCGTLKVNIQNNIVVHMVKVPEEVEIPLESSPPSATDSAPAAGMPAEGITK